MTSPSDRSQAIDLLRGVAVLLVMAAHLPFTGHHDAVYPGAPIADVLRRGQYGVNLFLVISGYCIHVRWARRADVATRVPFLPFWRRRLTRLYPPFVVMVAVTVTLKLLATRLGLAPSTPVHEFAGDVVVLLLLLQNFTDASARLGNAPFWSLALEEQLYLLYFPLLWVRRTRGWSAALALAFTGNAVWLSLESPVLHLAKRGAFPVTIAEHWKAVGPAYWAPWVLGALLAEYHLGHVRLPAALRSPWLGVGLLSTAFWLPVGIPQAMLVTFGFVPLLAACIDAERAGGLRASWTLPLVRVGGWSYGIYLAHNVAYGVVQRVLARVVALPQPLVIGVRFAVGLLAGYAFYRLFERPFLARAQKVPVPLIVDGASSPG